MIPATLRLSLKFGLALAVLATAARAHQHPCGHTHNQPFPDDLISCSSSGAACTQDGNGGTCKQITEFSRAWCECQTSGSGGGGGCVSLGVYYFDDQDAGPPAPMTSPIYLATPDSVNGATLKIGNAPGIDFDAKTEFVTGNFTVFFPAFNPGDPEVLAILEDVSIVFAPVGASGPNSLALADGMFQDLVYNSATGRLAPADPAGIALHLDNNFFADLPVRLHFEGRYRPDGSLEVLFQHVAVPELFADGLEWGDTQLWSATQP